VVRRYLGHNSAFEQFQYLKKASFTILIENTAIIKTKVQEKLSEGSNRLSMLVKKDEIKLPKFCHGHPHGHDFVSYITLVGDHPY